MPGHSRSGTLYSAALHLPFNASRHLSRNTLSYPFKPHRGTFVSSKTHIKLYALCYMMITYALMFVFVLVFIDFAIGDSTEDVW